MGFAISWLAIHGKSKQAVLGHLGLLDTGDIDEANESPISGSELPGDWYIIFLNDVVHPFVQPEFLADISRGCLAVACQVEEHVMFSAARAYQDGAELWSVSHESEQGPRHLVEYGKLPGAYGSTKAALSAEQDEGDQEGHGVDYIWDIPVTLAYEVVGYRHDNVRLKSGHEPSFTSLVGAP